MSHEILIPPTEEELEAFLPIERVRSSCLVANARQDERLAGYRRLAYTDGEFEARASFLPQTLRATLRVPFSSTGVMGLETKLVDLDGMSNAFRLPHGPILSVESIQYVDASGVASEVIDSAQYALETGGFVRWNRAYSFLLASQRPTIQVIYRAGFQIAVASIEGTPAIAEQPTLSSLRIAIEETIMAKWDARGGMYVMPTSAQRAFRALRTSRTYVPGARS